MARELDASEIELDEANDTDPRWAERAESVFDQLARTSWKELEAVEHDGYLLFPEAILYRTASGKFEQKPCKLRVPRKHEIRQAHIDARAAAAKQGLDPKLSPGLFEDLESLHILWRAVRNTTAPYEPLEIDATHLEKLYDSVSLEQLWGKLESYRRLLDPTPELITREAFLALVMTIAERRDISPLNVISGRAASSCIVTMATLLAPYLPRNSLSASSEISTPDFSPSETSTLSSEGVPTRKEGQSSTSSSKP